MLCISMAVLSSQSLQLHACGGYYDEAEDAYRFFTAEDLRSPGDDSYGFGEWTLFSKPDPGTKSNLQEWVEYFKAGEAPDNVEALIFDSSPLEFDSVAKAVSTGKALPRSFTNNYLAKYWKAHPEDPAFTYLQFAKRCESFATLGDDWYEGEIKRDTSPVSMLISEGLALHKNCRSEDLRARYGFQLVRLAHYSNNFEACRRFYYDLIENNRSGSVIRYRAMNHMAGALINRAGQSNDTSILSEAVIMLSRLYSKVDASLMVAEDLERFNARNYLEAEKLLKDKKDKINLWQLAGFTTFPLYVALDKVYQLDPRSPVCERMLVSLMTGWQTTLRKRDEDSEIIQTELTETRKVIDRIARKKMTARPALWNMAAGFLAFLDHDIKNSAAWYSKNRKVKDSLLSAAQDRLNIALEASQLPYRFDRNKAASLLGKIKDPELLHFTIKRLDGTLSGMDERLRKYIWAFIVENHDYLYYSIYNISDIFPLDRAGIDSMISAFHAPMDALSKALWRITSLDDTLLHVIKVDVLVNESSFAEAASLVKKYGLSGDDLPADPFSIRITDCHDCDHARQKTALYTKYEFISKMGALEEEIGKTASPAKKAKACFEYANGLYNITWYGNVRAYVMDLDYGFIPEEENLNANDYGLSEGTSSDKPYVEFPAYYYNCRPAMKYYLMAAQNSDNKEFKARCLFMAAKCEQNEFYNRGGIEPDEYDSTHRELKNMVYRKHFKELQAYSSTAFYRQAIKECSFFAHYSRRKR